MKSISRSWQVFSGKTLRLLFTIALVAFWTACADDSQNLNGPDAASKGSVKSTSSFGDYNIALSVTASGTIWTYTITKARATAKTLSHLIINLQNCGDESPTFNDIDYATINGVPASFVNTEGSGTTCNPQSITSNFVKINDIPSATSWVIVIKFDRGYQKVMTKGWIKAGSSCNISDVYGPGCPITEQCSYGQGRFFANGYDNNGSIAQWPLKNNNPVLTIGGMDYTPAETNALWGANTGQGQSDVMKAFFQLGALKISKVSPPELADEITTIENFYAGLAKVIVSTCTRQNGPNTVTFDCINLSANAAVSDAAAEIGKWIAANECR